MSAPTPPVAPKIPHTITQLGRTRTDDYAWMKDDNWQQVLRDPKALKADVRAHLEAENAYTKAVLAGTEALQAAMFAEMKGRIKEDDSSVPAPDGPWACEPSASCSARASLALRITFSRLLKSWTRAPAWRCSAARRASASEVRGVPKPSKAILWRPLVAPVARMWPT